MLSTLFNSGECYAWAELPLADSLGVDSSALDRPGDCPDLHECPDLQPLDHEMARQHESPSLLLEVRPASSRPRRCRVVLSKRIANLIASSALFFATGVSAAPYTFHDLGTLGGTVSYSYGLNDSGQVVGASATPGDQNTRAALWNIGASAVDLGTLGGRNSIAFAINSQGWVVGASPTTASDVPERATLWRGAEIIDLGNPSYVISQALSINDDGYIVGNSVNQLEPFEQRTRQATLWNPSGVSQFLDSFGGRFGEAVDINASGQIVGRATYLGDDKNRAALWSNGNPPVDLGTLGGTSSIALAINNAGQIVGYSQIAGNSTNRAVLWDGASGPIDLGTLGGLTSHASDINDAGLIVGFSARAGTGGTQYATLWESGAPVDLNDLIAPDALQPGWHLVSAMAINNRGWITGVAMNGSTGEQRAYLLTIDNAVPEPKSFALVILGIGLMLAAHRTRPTIVGELSTPRALSTQ